MRKSHILPDIILHNLFVKKKMHQSVIFTRIWEGFRFLSAVEIN